MKKVNNFQDEFPIHDIEIARDVVATHNCGMSRIALKAPDQVYIIHRGLMKERKGASATIRCMTLKLHYAIQVWCKAALISAENPGDLLYYWWIRWTSDDYPFKRLEYNKFYRDITVEQLLQGFWELLEQIANSGEIKVSEGYRTKCDGSDGIGNMEPKVFCSIILDMATGSEIDEKVKDVYTYPYNRELRTFKWEEIKDFFYEMSLHQLRLTMPQEYHNNTALDNALLYACSKWDIDLIKLLMKRGANINCLNDEGKSVLQTTVEYFKWHGVLIDKDYSKEELKVIESANEKKCKEVVDLLLSYGADINLFGREGMPPLLCAFYERSPEMIKFLLERGSSPNMNCYLDNDHCWSIRKNIRSTILDVIDGLIYEDYGDEEGEIERLIREAGGRQYVWDFNPWTYGNEGKYVVHMTPSTEGDKLFGDNAKWWIGTDEELVIEDKDGNMTTIALNDIEGLRQWNADFQANITNPDYDWQSWKKRGYELACQVAKLLSDKVALFYLYDNENVVEKASWHPDHTPSPNELQLCRDGKPIKIE